jgi:hypothetical protein
MLAPIAVVNPRVMTDQYPENKNRSRKRKSPRKPELKPDEAKNEDGAHFDITA